MNESVIFFVIALPAFAAAAIIAIPYFFPQARAVDFFHKIFRSTPPGFPDLLRYSAVIADGVVLGKGGELIATFQYRGPDIQCSDESKLEYLRARVENMNKTLGAGWMLHATMLRGEATEYIVRGAFRDDATLLIDAERERQYRSEGVHFENNYFITFTYLPPKVIMTKVKGFFFTKPSDISNEKETDLTHKHIAAFENRLTMLVGNMEAALGTRLTRLRTRIEEDRITRSQVIYDDQVAFLHECLSGSKHPIRLPSKQYAFGLDFIVGAHSLHAGLQPKLDDRLFIRVIGFDTPPDEWTHFGMMDILNALGVSIRFTTRWIPMEKNAAIRLFERIQNMWGQKVRGIDAMKKVPTGRVNQDALAKKQQVDAALKDLHGNEAAYGTWTATVVLMHENPELLALDVKYVIKALTSRGMVVRDEGLNCVDAYLGSLPGHGYENVRNAIIHSWNVADLMMLTSVWQGLSRNPCSFFKKFYPDGIAPPLLYAATSGGTPFAISLHAGDVGHTFLAGPTGSGKSTSLALLIASHFRYPNARVYAFEKGESTLALCMAAGGTQYNFFSEDDGVSGFKFAPFALIDSKLDQAWAKDYLTTILELHRVTISPDIRHEISITIELLATHPRNMRSITHLVQLFQNPKIKTVLSLYEKDLADGMLNGKEDTISLERFTLFEIEQLMGKKDEHTAPVLLYIFRMIERQLDGSPTMIVLDEAWVMLSNPIFAAKIQEWLKVLRKACGQVIFSTQEIQDIMSLQIMPSIVSACQVKIFLPNSSATNEINLNAYINVFGLPRRAVELIAGATPKLEYLFVHPEGMRLISFEMGPITLALVAVSEISERKKVKELVANYGKGDAFLWHWLKFKGVDTDKAYQLINN